MSEEEILQKMKDFYGDDLASPVHEPLRFFYQAKIMNYIPGGSYASENGNEGVREGQSEVGQQEAQDAQEQEVK